LGQLQPPQQQLARGGAPPCVNPRAMNYYSAGIGRKPSDSGAASPRSARRIEAHYELREVLGDGTSGQVRKAIHRHSGKEYAVKVISLRRHLDLTSMENEVTMMQSLDHPYIVQLVDVFVHHGIAMYLVMELVSGGDLFDRIVQQERYSEVDARRVMRRLLSAIYYLHQTKQVVHRDLKPENVLCSSPTSVKLADFGLAKMIQSDGLKTFCGTPQYFAPEVLQRRTTVAGSGRYGKPADMWSLGVILYILLAGRPPFEADLDPLQAFDALDFEESIWKDMPHARELVEHMLRLDPKRRITVRQACDHPWINTEDGDTHVHPLDDPAVTGRKRLFSESSDKHPVTKESTEKPIGDNASVASKDSVLSNEGFAAAANSLCRGDSIQYTDIHMADASPNDADPDKDIDTDGTDDVVYDGEMDVEMELETSLNQDDINIETVEKCNVAPETTNSASPDIEVKCEASVTPTTERDESDVPRSPLAAMNLNARSNGFRVQVLGKENSATDHKMNQVAVTPTASNVRLTQVDKTRNHNHDNDTSCEVEEDPILSQFSSGPSSVDSFLDSLASDPTPVAVNEKAPHVEKDDHHEVTVGKRKRNEKPKNEKEDQADGKGGNQKLVVQKKLSDWFVAKKPKIGSKKNF
jgi:serine/threonine protein kinase